MKTSNLTTNMIISTSIFQKNVSHTASWRKKSKPHKNIKKKAVLKH